MNVFLHFLLTSVLSFLLINKVLLQKKIRSFSVLSFSVESTYRLNPLSFGIFHRNYQVQVFCICSPWCEVDVDQLDHRGMKVFDLCYSHILSKTHFQTITHSHTQTHNFYTKTLSHNYTQILRLTLLHIGSVLCLHDIFLMPPKAKPLASVT